MDANFDKIAINKLLNDFTNATGLSIAIKDAMFNEIGRSNITFNCFCRYIQSSSVGATRCYRSDAELFRKCNLSGKPEIHTCHAGLTDMAIPIIFNDTVMAYIILGQIKKDVSIDEIYQKIRTLNLDKKIIESNYNSIQSFSNEKIESIANIAIMLVEHILFKNLIEQKLDVHTQKAVEYINEHISEMIEISDICTALNVSKSVIYKNFEKQFGMPPKKYINVKKVENAKTKLRHTNNSVEQIAVSLGYENIGYFYRLFKMETGMTPLQYRNKHIS